MYSRFCESSLFWSATVFSSLVQSHAGSVPFSFFLLQPLLRVLTTLPQRNEASHAPLASEPEGLSSPAVELYIITPCCIFPLQNARVSNRCVGSYIIVIVLTGTFVIHGACSARSREKPCLSRSIRNSRRIPDTGIHSIFSCQDLL